jgi:transcriptional regulator with XRE-family HTH domain
MSATVQGWRKRNHLTQVDAAALLGVSQTYLSLLEKGARPVTKTVRSRLALVQGDGSAGADERFRAQLSALGYPGFAHLQPARPKPRPDTFLVSVLSQSNVDARVVEALPWLVRNYGEQLDLPWLVRQAKLRSFQNRLGFLLRATKGTTQEFLAAVEELESARLLREDTLCWESMPEVTRRWMREHRSPLAVHWNVVTTLQPENQP